MQHKRPTAKQKEVIAAAGLDPKDWLIVQDLPNTITVINKKTDRIDVLEKAELVKPVRRKR